MLQFVNAVPSGASALDIASVVARIADRDHFAVDTDVAAHLPDTFPEMEVADIPDHRALAPAVAGMVAGRRHLAAAGSTAAGEAADNSHPSFLVFQTRAEGWQLR